MFTSKLRRHNARDSIHRASWLIARAIERRNRVAFFFGVTAWTIRDLPSINSPPFPSIFTLYFVPSPLPIFSSRSINKPRNATMKFINWEKKRKKSKDRKIFVTRIFLHPRTIKYVRVLFLFQAKISTRFINSTTTTGLVLKKKSNLHAHVFTCRATSRPRTSRSYATINLCSRCIRKRARDLHGPPSAEINSGFLESIRG